MAPYVAKSAPIREPTSENRRYLRNLKNSSSFTPFTCIDSSVVHKYSSRCKKRPTPDGEYGDGSAHLVTARSTEKKPKSGVERVIDDYSPPVEGNSNDSGNGSSLKDKQDAHNSYENVVEVGSSR